MPPALALEVRQLVVSYRGRRVVDGLDLEANPGAVTAVLGPNGAGKTTTIECAEGLRRPDSGTLRVLGHAPGSAPARAATGTMLQDGGLPQARSVRAVLELACAVRGLEAARGLDLSARLGLEAVWRLPVRRLSGGQRQRLAFAVAIVDRPALAFLDEPSAGLDPHARADVWEVVRELRAAGTAVVLTTHLLTEAEELADVVHVVAAGRRRAWGTPRELVAAHASRNLVRATLADPLDPRAWEDLRAHLERIPGEPRTAQHEAGLVSVVGTEPDAPLTMAAIATWCAQTNHPLLELRTGGGTLEHAYLALTGAVTPAASAQAAA